MKGSVKPSKKPASRPEWLAVGQRLEMARNVLGLSQKSFLEGTGISQPHYSGIKDGTKRLTFEKARELKRAHGISLDFIFDGEIGMDMHMMRALQTMTKARERLQEQPKEHRPSVKPS